MPVLAALAVVFCAAIAAELSGPGASEAPVRPQAPLAALPRQGAPPADASQAQLVAALLTRPPFAPDRRPDPGQGAATDPGLPHLTGILISGDDRRAIFTTNEAGRPEGRSTVVREGDSLGAYRVEAISPASVILTGPGGSHTVQPHFSNAPPPVPGLASNGLAGLPPPPIAMQDPGRPGGPLGLAMYRNGPAAPAPAVPLGLGNTQ